MKGVGFMIMNYVGKNMEVTDALREVTEKKLADSISTFKKTSRVM